jgi:MFS family permease
MAKQSTNEGDNGVDNRALKHAFSDWKVYVIAVMYMCMNVNLSSIGGFLPTIVKGLGYTAAQAQLFTVPPYAVALAVTVLVSTLSDRLQSRGFPLALTYCIGVAGWGILLGLDAASKASPTLKARYFGVICVVAPAYATIPLQLSWVASNNPSQTQRAVALGMLNTIGQCGSIIGSFIFPSSEGPQYVPGVSVNIAFQCFGALVAVLMSLYYRRENARRDRVEGGRPESSGNLDVQADFDRAKGKPPLTCITDAQASATLYNRSRDDRARGVVGYEAEGTGWRCRFHRDARCSLPKCSRI